MDNIQMNLGNEPWNEFNKSISYYIELSVTEEIILNALINTDMIADYTNIRQRDITKLIIKYLSTLGIDAS